MGNQENEHRYQYVYGYIAKSKEKLRYIFQGETWHCVLHLCVS